MLGGLYVQPGGTRTLPGTWSIKYGEDKVTGGDTTALLRPGNTITAGQTQHTVGSTGPDGFTLTSPWGGTSSESATIQVSGLLPAAAPKTAEGPRAPGEKGGAGPGGSTPIYKNPWVILLTLAAAGGVGYYVWRRRRSRR